MEKTKVTVFTLKERGNKLYKEQDYTMASAMYKKHIKSILKTHLDSPHILASTDIDRTYHNLALCFFKMEEYQKCVEACQNALHYNPNYSKAYYRLAEAYEKLSDGYNQVIAIRKYCESMQKEHNEQELKKNQEYRGMVKKMGCKFKELIQPKPCFVEERYRVPEIKSQQKDQHKYSQQINKYFDWQMIGHLLDNKQYRTAINICYYLLNNLKTPKIRDKAKLLISSIKNCLQSQSQSEESNWKQTLQELAQLFQQTFHQKQGTVPQLSIEQLYQQYFLSQLKKKTDLFQGFFEVLKSILTDASVIKKITVNNKYADNMTQLLQMIAYEYDMFDILKQSLSKQQSDEIRQWISSLIRISDQSSLIDQYCQE